MSGSRKLLFIGCFLIIDLLLVCGFLLIRDITFKNILRSEVAALSDLNFSFNRYNSDIKSEGDYALIEEAFKNYLDNYALGVQDVLDVVDDNMLRSLLSVDNILNDGPDFVNSIEYVEKLRDNFNYNMDLLFERSYDVEINDYIYAYISDDKYVQLYHNLLMENNFINEINDNQLILENKRIEINSHLSAFISVLEFLKSNCSNYNVVNGDIKFIDSELEFQYNELVAKTKRIYE